MAADRVSSWTRRRISAHVGWIGGVPAWYRCGVGRPAESCLDRFGALGDAAAHDQYCGKAQAAFRLLWLSGAHVSIEIPGARRSGFGAARALAAFGCRIRARHRVQARFGSRRVRALPVDLPASRCADPAAFPATEPGPGAAPRHRSGAGAVARSRMLIVGSGMGYRDLAAMFSGAEGRLPPPSMRGSAMRYETRRRAMRN